MVTPRSLTLVAAAYRYGREQLGLTAAQAMRRARLRHELSCPCAGHREQARCASAARKEYCQHELRFLPP